MLRTSRVLFACFFFASLGFAGVSYAQIIVLNGGLDDDFTLPVEAAEPSDALLATLGNTLPGESSDFDEPLVNAPTSHTFEIPSGVSILGATLEFAAQGNPQSGAAGNAGDGLFLLFADATPDDLVSEIVYSRTFGDTEDNGANFTDNDPGLLTPGVVWTESSSATIVLDLSALPLVGGGTLDIIPLINANGFLDITLGDDSVADFARLTITTVPEPSTVSVVLLVGFLFGTRRRRV